LPPDPPFDPRGAVIGLRFSGSDFGDSRVHLGLGSITWGQPGSAFWKSDASPLGGSLADRSFGAHCVALQPEITPGHRESLFAGFRNNSSRRIADNLLSTRSRSSQECPTRRLGLVASHLSSIPLPGCNKCRLRTGWIVSESQPPSINIGGLITSHQNFWRNTTGGFCLFTVYAVPLTRPYGS
jgi:hypothetical protein